MSVLSLSDYKKKTALVLVLAVAIVSVLLPFAFAQGSSQVFAANPVVTGGQYNLASMLGISGYAAKKIIDILSMASSVWAVIGIILAVIGTGGVSIWILATAKALISKYGKKYAAAW